MAGPYPANLAVADLQDLALARAVARGEVAALGRALAGSAVDPGRLLDLTNRHGLSGALYRVLERLGPELRLDLDLLDRARRRYLRQWGRNESLARELASLCETFERHGVEVL